ncbi:MAG: hypothetical protein H6610_07285 [Ignavibacteriales bacterium]|nr:hypothetical protein [Ignavibacteriales bacterium]
MGGIKFTNTWGVYGTKGTASTSNFPGSRAASVAWQDGNGNLYLWGGHGYGSQQFWWWQFERFMEIQH